VRRHIDWAAIWLAAAFVAFKAAFLAVPHAPGPADFVHDLAGISHRDLLFAAAAWACARGLLAAARGRAQSAIALAFVACCAAVCLYALASVIAFRPLGGFLTWSLLQLIGNVRMLGSSVRLYLTPTVVLGLVGAPTLYVALVAASVRWIPPVGRRTATVVLMAAAAWAAYGEYVFATDWYTHNDWRVAENAPWVLVSSTWRAWRGGEAPVKLPDAFDAADLADFEPPPPRPPRAVPRPPNVLFIVLESVSARWTSISGGRYDTTPTLKAESAHGLVADSFYAHVGRSSNALAAMLLSIYPKLDFRDFTEEFPHPKQPSLAQLFRARGYRTAFITPSDMDWAGWRDFLKERGFDEVRDYRGLPCTNLISTWGVEDRCMVDGMLEYIGKASGPFFVMGWTTQTHHPYEPSPDAPFLHLLREQTPDDYELERYLNVLHETDRHLERLFEAVRQRGIADDTVVVVIGDHGQAFGYPHDSYVQGRTAYEEDVHIPLLIWSPRLYPSPAEARAIASQVDLPPTIADLAGLAAPREWEGRSVFDPQHPPRAYFYVAQDQFKLGVREHDWKYIYDLRAGSEELYDLAADRDEQHNVASAHRDVCARLRQRLAAWNEANRRRYAAVP